MATKAEHTASTGETAMLTVKKPDGTESRVRVTLKVSNRSLTWTIDGENPNHIDLQKLIDLKVTKQPPPTPGVRSTVTPSMMLKWTGKERNHTLVLEFSDYQKRDKVKDSIIQCRKQENTSNTPAPTLRVLPSLLQAKARALLNNPALGEAHATLVRDKNIITEEEFWKMHEKYLLNETENSSSQQCGMRNLHYAASLNSTATDTQINLNLDKNTLQDILREHPEVKKAYEDNVPHNISEKKFFESFFASMHFRRTVARNDEGLEEDIFKVAEQALNATKKAPQMPHGPAALLCADHFDERAAFSDGYGVKYNAEHSRLPPRPDMKEFATRVQGVIGKYNKHSGAVVGSMVDGNLPSEGNSFREGSRLVDLEPIVIESYIPLAFEVSSNATFVEKTAEGKVSELWESQMLGIMKKYSNHVFSVSGRSGPLSELSKVGTRLPFQYPPSKRRALDKEGNRLYYAVQEALRHYWALFFDHQGDLIESGIDADRHSKLVEYLTALRPEALAKREGILVECIDRALRFNRSGMP